MAYTPDNNPYIPGDPYSYDLKWMVRQIKETSTILETLNEKIAAAIMTFLDEHDPIYYATAQDLIDSNIKAGSLAYIMGYHTQGDGGANLYYITSDYNEIVGLDFYLTLDGPNRWAIPIIVTPYVTPEMFGAYGNGSVDDTDAINLVIKAGSRILFTKTYLVRNKANDCVTISGVSGKELSFSNGSQLVAINQDLATSNVIKIENASDISIINAHLVGDADENTDTSDGAGHCLSIKDAQNIRIIGGIYEKAHTDSIYMIRVTDSKIQGVVCRNGGRMGLTITGGKNIEASDLVIDDFNRAAPKSGIGIEPNYSTDDLENIIIHDVRISNVDSSGFYVNAQNLAATQIISVSFNHITVETATRAGMFKGVSANTGTIRVSNILAVNTKEGPYLNDIDAASTLYLIMSDCVDVGCNTLNAAANYGSIITDSTQAHGNIIGNNIMSLSPNVVKTCRCQMGTIQFNNVNFEILNINRTHPERYLGDYPDATITEAGTYHLDYRHIKAAGTVTIRAGFTRGVVFDAYAIGGQLSVVGASGVSITDGTTTGTRIDITQDGYADIISIADNVLLVRSSSGGTIS